MIDCVVGGGGVAGAAATAGAVAGAAAAVVALAGFFASARSALSSAVRVRIPVLAAAAGWASAVPSTRTINNSNGFNKFIEEEMVSAKSMWKKRFAAQTTLPPSDA